MFHDRARRKILIMGLPGAGKTTLATTLAPLLNAIVFNADAVRSNISRDLGFSHKDRIEHARRMSWMCDRVVEAGGTVIADFICPTEETRAAFGEAFTIWIDRISAGRFEDTNQMFVGLPRRQARPPAHRLCDANSPTRIAHDQQSWPDRPSCTQCRAFQTQPPRPPRHGACQCQ
jgi:shikimate kinase